MLSKVESTNDIVTRDEYANFELEFEWKLHEGGNAGMFYRGTEEFQKIYFTAPEYQLLDDADASRRQEPADLGRRRLCALSGARGRGEAGRQWNSSRIVARGAHVEHWLNGQKVVEYEVGEPRLGGEGQGQQVRDVGQVRSNHQGPHRHPGRSRGRAGHPQHAHPHPAMSDGNDITRREAVARTALFLGGTLAASSIAGVRGNAWALTAAPGWRAGTLTAGQSELVATIAEHIIPATDTPGARAAGVHRFVDVVLSDFYKDDERKRFLDGLAALEARAERELGAPFLKATPQQQLALLTRWTPSRIRRPSGAGSSAA